jgi:hypothetical protein
MSQLPPEKALQFTETWMFTVLSLIRHRMTIELSTANDSPPAG